MYFLVDYENIGNSGLRGSEHLTHEDAVIIFYSGTCHSIENRYLNNFTRSGCWFEAVPLQKAYQNALDFYIATKVGELFGVGYRGAVGIVSKDKGYLAVKDYWAMRQTPEGQRFYVPLSPRATTNCVRGDRSALYLNDVGDNAVSDDDEAEYGAIIDEDIEKRCDAVSHTMLGENSAKMSIVVAESIERAIFDSNVKSERRRLITASAQQQNIGKYYKTYVSNRVRREKLAGIFIGSSVASRLDEIESMVVDWSAQKGSARALYLEAMRRFGLQDGRFVYQGLKDSEFVK